MLHYLPCHLLDYTNEINKLSVFASIRLNFVSYPWTLCEFHHGFCPDLGHNQHVFCAVSFGAGGVFPMRWKRNRGWRLVGAKWCYLCVWPDIHWKDPYDGGRALAFSENQMCKLKVSIASSVQTCGNMAALQEQEYIKLAYSSDVDDWWLWEYLVIHLCNKGISKWILQLLMFARPVKASSCHPEFFFLPDSIRRKCGSISPWFKHQTRLENYSAICFENRSYYW